MNINFYINNNKLYDDEIETDIKILKNYFHKIILSWFEPFINIYLYPSCHQDDSNGVYLSKFFINFKFCANKENLNQNLLWILSSKSCYK